jgi:hypothetical protein
MKIFLFPFLFLNCYVLLSQTSTYLQDTALTSNRSKTKLNEMTLYLKEHPSFNQSIVILIDFKIFSGTNRLFVYDINSGELLKSALVAHGIGSETENPDSLIFSNIPDTYMSSLGKYKIGKSYVGGFGKSYKLHGLESTNSKAYERFIVLHKLDGFPEIEQIEPIPTSLGCPMVSESTFNYLDNIIQASSKPIIMEIYY